MPHVLIASDAEWIHAELESVLSGSSTTIAQLRAGADVLAAVRERQPDLLILDFQIGAMGGVATCLELRLEESAHRLDHVPVLLLLDRRADVFMAKRSGAEGWVIKPLDAIRIRRAAAAVMGGGTFHDESYVPAVVDAAIAAGAGDSAD